MAPERWLYKLPLRLKSIFRRRQVERELHDELADHMERLVESNVSQGMSPAEARRQARLTMGTLDQQKEECRDTRSVDVLENLLRDARYALGSLRRSPGFTLVAVLTLGLGIGANTAIFTVVNSVLLRPLPYRDADRLVLLKYQHVTTVAPATFSDWTAPARSFESTGLADWWTPNLTGSDRPEQLRALHISASILPMMGVAPMLGRVFRADEEHQGRDRVVVLSYPYWKARFNADRGVIGKTVTLDGEPYAIVGVMPEGFDFAPFWATRIQVWAPLDLDQRKEDRDGSSFRAFARLGNGVTLDAARSEIAAITARVEQQYPRTSKGVEVTPLQEIVVGDVHDSLMILLAAVAFVLLIACANVAHLQLMRAAAREREFAVRTALGASRRRILQQSFVESVILAGSGAVLGLILAWVGVKLLVALGPSQLPRLDAISMDGRVLGFLAGSIVFAALIFGAAPALAAARADVQGALKEGSRGASESGRRGRFRGILVGSEFAMAVVLLVGAGLVLKSFFALLAVDPGFDPRNLLSAQVSVEGTGHFDPERRAAFFQDLVQRAGALPGVEAAGAINHLPLNGDNWRFPYYVDGVAPVEGHRTSAIFRVVKPGYFHAMRIPLVEGRDVTSADEAGAAHVVVINEMMARRGWPGKSALGQRISVNDPAKKADWFTVVGVSKDARQSGWTEPGQAEMYFPYLTAPSGTEEGSLLSFLDPKYMTLVLRTTNDPAALAKPLEGVVREMERDAPVADVITMEQAVSAQFAAPRFYLLLMGVFAGVAVLLAAVGVYGVISYSVARRTREIGVRLALGAHRGEVFGLIVRQGMRLALIGGAVGLAGALVITRFLRTLLFGVRPTDPATFVLGTLVLGLVALVSCAIPARRAAGVEPATVLRSE